MHSSYGPETRRGMEENIALEDFSYFLDSRSLLSVMEISVLSTIVSGSKSVIYINKIRSFLHTLTCFLMGLQVVQAQPLSGDGFLHM